MSVLYFNGFETGDASQIEALATGWSISTARKRTGAYAITTDHSAQNNSPLTTALNASTLYVRFYTYNEFIANPNAAFVQGAEFSIQRADNSVITYLAAIHQAPGVGIGSGTPLQKSHYINGGVDTPWAGDEFDTYVRWEVKVVCHASAGIIEWYRNGVLITSQTGLNTGANATQLRVSAFNFNGGASGFTGWSNLWIDDVQARNDAYPGPGGVIARQGKAGTPTYDAWTKTSSQTAAQVWSETPFSASNNAATTGAIAAAQTMFAGDISAGTDAIGIGDVINAVQVGLIAKTSGVASAVTSTWKAAIYSTTTASSYATTGTYTPKSHALLVAFVVTTLGATPLDPTTVTGHGVSFTKLTLSARTLSTTHAVSVWVANSGASPSTAAVTADYAGVSQTGGVVIEYEVEGADMSTSAVAAIVQNPTNTGSGTAQTVTLAAAGNSANRALIFGVHLSNTAPTAAGAWTLTAGAAGNFNTPATGAIGLFNNSSFDTAGAATGANVSWRMVGLEIKCDLTSGGKLSVRRRIAAADTDEAVTLTTSDAFYSTSIFTDTRANLLTAEIGAIKQISYQSRTHTIEDVWLMVDYTAAFVARRGLTVRQAVNRAGTY